VSSPRTEQTPNIYRQYEQLPNRIKAAKEQANRIGTDEIRHRFRKEIVDLCNITCKVVMLRNELKTANPNYLDELASFPAMKLVFENIDAYCKTCYEIEEHTRGVIYSAVRAHAKPIQPSEEELKMYPNMSLFQRPRFSERLNKNEDEKLFKFKF
jgi:hypothetical protein